MPKFTDQKAEVSSAHKGELPAIGVRSTAGGQPHVSPGKAEIQSNEATTGMRKRVVTFRSPLEDIDPVGTGVLPLLQRQNIPQSIEEKMDEKKRLLEDVNRAMAECVKKLSLPFRSTSQIIADKKALTTHRISSIQLNEEIANLERVLQSGSQQAKSQTASVSTSQSYTQRVRDDRELERPDSQVNEDLKGFLPRI